ncbi:MotA/TolQ/ExbB proton channel family protein [Thiothrix eikelboomii]|uniref:MotA/TolQ/ExbB proton channel family protein n=1 Tax=Thiothrix eikelboomii TaxID=92487 RepID=A0A1T4VYZ1_9GAMM|nr:MotA/TolQ/ExbB proton channel family protein [Thiothrix eikelboomii]SKA70203.1 MotA/TolQ/ExbB proton channel family protein [Thiothrix eikelboomii]
MTKHAWVLPLQWLWLFSLLLVSLVILWDQGLLQVMFATDNTYLCPFMVALFLLTCLHCGYRSLFLAQQIQVLVAWPQRHPHKTADSLIFGYLQELQALPQPQDKQLTAELLGEALRGQHQVGWFITGLLIKLGLLGTVVGFVMMLGSMTELSSLDIAQVQTLMQQMTQGMKIALNTTIIGLVASSLLGLQYLILDRTADQILIAAIQASQLPLATETLEANTNPEVADGTV